MGLWGISQGGWITTLAAAGAGEVAFVVPFSGAGVSPAQQELFRISNNVRDLGGSPWVVAMAVMMARLTYDALPRLRPRSPAA